MRRGQERQLPRGQPSLRLALAWICGAAALLYAAAVQGQLGSRPWLGVSFEPSAAGANAGPGVRVAHVVRGSPAERSGLHDGDRILRVGTNRVGAGAEVVRWVGVHAAGDVVDIGFVRAGAEQSVHVTLGVFPSQDDVLRMDLVGSFAPAFRDITAVRGPFPSSLVALRGRVVLVDFWATWCGPCRLVAPKLASLQARYGAQGLSILGVSTEDVQDVASFAGRTAMGYSVGSDVHGDTTRAYGVSSLPTMVLIDKRGVVRDLSIGYDPGEDARLEQSIRALLAEPAPSD
jgi:thiol-disulfide isomerase/thioredoxin